MTSRLDRLVSLLDTGSTQSVRKSAAQQLGQIQKQHPEDFSSWDTRVAAGQAIESIGDQVAQWDPPPGSQTDEVLGLLSWDKLEITQVLNNGSPLLASQGSEFDFLDPNLDPKERLQLQKKRLVEQLGLGTQFMDVDFFDETDVSVKKEGSSIAVKQEQKDLHQIVERSIKEDKKTDDPFAGMSARERQQLKRKMKMASKSGTAFSVADVTKKRKTGEVDTENATVVAYKPKPDISALSVFSTGDEWPFEGLVEKLSFDLFSPRWETRHGAAIGLREIIKIHGKGYGKVVGNTTMVNNQRNINMLEDLAIRLICVLCLDRFVDFVGDQAVIPVRETCSQTLAVVLEHCSESLCLQIINKGLLAMYQYKPDKLNSNNDNLWAIRHAALIGIKFWMAVRQDLVPRVLVSENSATDSPTFLAIVEGLKDSNDDVRAVSSSALIPITDLLVTILPPKKLFDSIVLCLWDSLQELDDLTAATSFVMDLLSDLLKKPVISAVLESEASHFLEKLVPQLFPFFRHAVTSVRLAVLRTLITLANLGDTVGTGWITVDLLRLLFQNFVLEERKDVISTSLELWTCLIDLLSLNQKTSTGTNLVDDIVDPAIGILFALEMSPIGNSFDQRLFISYVSQQGRSQAAPVKKGGKKSSTVQGLNIPPQDRAMMNQDLTVIVFDDVLHGRIAGATALGRLICRILEVDRSHYESLQDWLMSHVNSGWGIHRIMAGIVIQEWVAYYKRNSSVSFLEAMPNAKPIWDTLMEILNAVNAGGSLSFIELQTMLQGVYGECIAIYNALKRMGYQQLPAMPPIQATEESMALNSPLGIQFSVETVEMFLDTICTPLIKNIPDSLAELYTKALSSKLAVSSFKKSIDPRVYSSLAASVVSMESIPAKLNPIIRNLMASIQFEESPELQRRSAAGIAKMLHLIIISGQKASINDKIVKNLCVFLCSDPTKVGIAKDVIDHSGTMTYTKLKTLKGIGKKKRKSVAAPVAIDGSAASAINDVVDTEANEAELAAKRMLHTGAEASIESLCAIFKGQLLDQVGALKDILTKPLLETAPIIISASGALDPKDEMTQRLIDSLHVLEITTRYIDASLYPQIIALMMPLKDSLTCNLAIVRNHSSTCLAAIAKIVKVPAMIEIIKNVLPLTNHTANDVARQGSVECIYHIIEMLQEDVLPYLIFLMAPLLSRMSDGDENVRFLATNGFAQLVKLAPLEAGAANPDGFTEELVSRKNNERKFIGQLIGTEKVQEFELPVVIAAELRGYQKEGVSWLAFLNRYGLHGILCDDMGLGKTLQSICIISADSYNRAEQFKKTGSPDLVHCPSLIVCPSPLTGHWYFEIKKYAEFMKPIIYIGDKNERANIRRKMMRYDVVIISYEVLRNDIDHLSKLRFNYCCLDEGHVIKNPSTKLTKAVKTVKAFHRLILSGTPVQNNVIDLWSLFDFLMPGFLGTAAQFNERFGKPILASRDAKASSREQERGALALEALHKQVLPFLMRRMKEDVLEDLPPKIIQDYYCELSDIQKMLYEDFSQMSGDVVGGPQEGKSTHVFQALQYLRKLCNHPSLVLTPSHPQYAKVNAKLVAEKRNINDIENAPKLVALQQLLLDCGIGVERTEMTGATAPHRVLIFAQVKQMLDMIQNDLFKKHMPSVTYMRLDGQVSDPMKRHEMIQSFNQDPSIDVLLLTTHVGGLGLNLTGADTVIFMEHDWNPMKDLQAMDRAHRIGQKRVVNVYRLITKGTLEEKIMGLQKFKLNISSAIINSENAGIASMGTDQIIDLFSLEAGEEQGKKDTSAKAGSGSKDVIEGLDQLWDEAEYDDLQVDDFLKNIKSRRMINRSIWTRIVILGTGILLGVLAYSVFQKEIPKTKRKKKVRQIQESNSVESFDASNWAVEESDNLLSLLISIAENEAISDTIIHRSVTCNHCGMSPLRGFRFKCANCVDFDLCAACEALDVHFKTHTFIKIRIPIPPQANPRSLIFPAFYPGIPWTNSASFDTFKLENETHFDAMEIIGFYDQFKSLSTVDTEDGGITKDTFEKCLGTLRKESQLIVDRIFLFFDNDKDGIISFEEMVKGLSILSKGTMEERVKSAFEGYDLDGNGLLSRDEFRAMFKSYFLISMELVRGVVKVMEEGMLENFDDEASKPVSAAFGAPSTLNDNADMFDASSEPTPTKEESLAITDSPPLNSSVAEHKMTTTPAHSSRLEDLEQFDAKLTEIALSPASLDVRPALAFMANDEHVPVMESISNDAIEEMVNQVFAIAGAQNQDEITLEQFEKVVESDVNVLAWIEALGSVF